ncbi:GNAT family N-acetyltransferase [Maribacter antarcticus]|uniref:GNAT family N-acetyltransferase n=1 Tax=Maribacter antarcticus TaxID=505250 RepID=UPI00047C096E|nr:GNAT family N-acetyltransferase [Maribacter antarcticus]
MELLKGKNLFLRALEKEDLQFLYDIENNTHVWEISGTVTPYSRSVLEFYLENAHRDIYEVKQLRLVICSPEGITLGLIDLFDFDPKHKRAGVGIVIVKEADRNKGIGAEALELLSNYAFTILELKQLYANILEENKRGIHLFQKLGFLKVGVKKDWISSNGRYKNEVLFQKINN